MWLSRIVIKVQAWPSPMKLKNAARRLHLHSR
jgi:hypothetical protein